MKTGRFILEPVIEDGKHAFRMARYGEIYKNYESYMHWDEKEQKTAGEYYIYRLIEEDIVWKPKEGEEYYLTDITVPDLYMADSWRDAEHDNHRLSLGLVFQTRGEAIKKAEEIISLIKNNQK